MRPEIADGSELVQPNCTPANVISGVQLRVATRLVLKYNIRAGGDHHLGPQVLLAVELDALFDGDEADLAMDQRFQDLDHLPAVGDGFHGNVQ